MIYRCILPTWASQEDPSKPKVVEGEFSEQEITKLNQQYYNIYYLPNYPSIYNPGTTVDGSQIDTFRFVFIDMDLKQGKHKDKKEFINRLLVDGFSPTYVVDSGNGVHAYWQVQDLDAMTFLRLQRRLMRKFDTDDAVAKIYQLMRVPNTVNTKHHNDFKLCEQLISSESIYTAEEIHIRLPNITPEDEAYCQTHFNKTYKINQAATSIDEKIPLKFAHLVRNNQEVKDIWSGLLDDRSKGDYRLGHIMFANSFTKDEAMSVLVNSAKALARAPTHRIAYATNIVDKIWLYEETDDKTTLNLSQSVKDILNKHGDTLQGIRFPCHSYLDNTAYGFRLGHVVGLVAGSGVGKTAMALNMFKGFVQNNPDYDHFFVPLEQPANEIADRWKTICGTETHLYDKVQVVSNYNDDGSFRHLSFTEIKDYILKYQQLTHRKVGCIVIDHIGALKKKGREGENQDLMDICHSMKSFAIETNTMVVMQSQAPREKAGIGDLELNKDAAYGTVYFESYCDYLITLWQPLKRCYSEPACPTIMAFKFCKIRHKRMGVDTIKEDVPYALFFDSKNESLRQLTQDEDASFKFFNNQATNKRKQDRKTDLITYTSIKVEA